MTVMQFLEYHFWALWWLVLIVALFRATYEKDASP